MLEIWKDIEGFEGHYQVSNFGRIKSLSRKSGNTIKKERILKPRDHTHGYSEVSLGKDMKFKNKFVHRLVAIAFIPNPDNKPQVNHINENKQDNRVENLEWVTAKYNINYKNLTYKKWENRRKRYKVTNLMNKEVKYYNNELSYEDMEKDGFNSHIRSRVNKSPNGLYVTSSKHWIELLD